MSKPIGMPIPLYAQIVLALLLDWLIGDPRWLVHPVVIMGRYITGLEDCLRRGATSARSLRWRGALLAVTLVGGSWLSTWLTVRLALLIHPWLGTLLSVWLLSTTLAARGLERAARQVELPLTSGDLPNARQALSMIVGRDTEQLPLQEIVRGVVETVAENTVDGVISPLIYAFIGGAPLAMAYKAVNTLDSMVGHLDERYRHFGWFSARLDDWANLLPARISAVLLSLAATISGHDGRRSWRTVRRDAHKHPSPNGGWPESAVAGALGVRLGGLNYYDCEPDQRSYLGDPHRELDLMDIGRTVRLMWLTTYEAATLGVAISWLIR